MPFDPTFPLDNSTAVAAQMRAQLNALKALIDATASVTSAQIDSVTTLPPGAPATVGLTLVGQTLHLTFGLPQGASGAPGAEGPPGEITQAQLDAAMVGSSANSNTVSTLGQVADGFYNQSQIQDLINKVDQLILTLRR